MELLNIKEVLELIFKIINKSNNYFADTYLLKDVSIISKWKNGKVTPKSEDITKIVEFVENESIGIQKKLIRDKIEYLIEHSLLDNSIKTTILKTEDFSLFLTQALIASISDTSKKSISNTNKSSLEAESKEVLLKNKVETISKQKIHFKPKILYKIIPLTLVFLIAIYITQRIYINKNSIVPTNNIVQQHGSLMLSEKYSLTYRPDTYSNNFLVELNNTPIIFSRPFRMFNNVFYLPAFEALSSMGFIVRRDPSTQTLFANTKDKTIILPFNSKTIVIDNRNITIKTPVVLQDDTLYMPVEILKLGLEPYLDNMIPQNIYININASNIVLDTPCRIINGKPFLPVRDILRKFNYGVDWSETLLRVTATKNKKIIDLKIGDPKIFINDAQFDISNPIFISNGKVFIPLEILELAEDVVCYWDNDKRILDIRSK